MEANVCSRIAPGALTYHKFHGRDRKIDCLTLLQKDIVFTTYGTVAADYSRKRSLLHQVHWYRVVLDEGMHVPRRFANNLHSLISL